MYRFSIIIPVLNEAAVIESQLQMLQSLRQQGVELILVDGGSEDDTARLAEPLVDQVSICRPGRSRQMNQGARLASGTYLLFLHADTRLPENVMECLGAKASDQVPWGFFAVRLSGQHWMLRVVERFMSWRSRLTKIATGDQSLFIRRELFLEMGGFADIPLMEDVAFCQSLRQLSLAPAWLSTPVITSSRRWEENGIFKTIVLMWRLRFEFFIGISPHNIVKSYYKNV